MSCSAPSVPQETKIETPTRLQPADGCTSECQLEPVSTETTVAPSCPPADSSTQSSPFRILLVEDHADVARLLARLLSIGGYHVDIAETLHSALDLAANNPYDLVVSDLGLPDGNGFDLMKQLSSQYGLKGIALSGYNREEHAHRIQESGFVDYLTKPVTHQTLQGAVDLHLGQTRPASLSN